MKFKLLSNNNFKINTLNFISVGFTKATSAFIIFFLTLLITRNMSTENAGLFLYGLTLATVLSSFVRLGLDNPLLRFMSTNSNNKIAQEKLNRGITWVLGFSAPISILGVLFSEWIATNIINKPDIANILSVIVIIRWNQC